MKKKNKLLFKIIYFSYKSNFNQIQNINKFSFFYTSDTGWGCMIRCGQMIMSRGLYKYLKKNLKISTFQSIKETIKYFLDLPYLNEDLPICFEKMKTILNNSKIIYAPFSINNLCLFGNLCNKSSGEWFSDVNMSYLFNKISFVFNLFDNLEILNFQTGFYLSDLLEKCFNILEDNNHQISNFYEFNDKKYEFKKSGIIFISVRIGIDFISKEYYENIRNLFNCKQCLGIIGGRTNSAYYFIGYNNEGNLLYLDPHITNDSILDFDNESIYHNYLNKNINSMNISNMSTAFTVGFIFRNIDEFKLLINYLIQYVSKEFSCFWVSTKNKEDINKNLDYLKEYIDNDEDDF
jgi:cysteine protease ATG4